MPFNHFDDAGQAWMVDVSGKEPTRRRAVAEALVDLGPELARRLQDRVLAKGDVLAVARLAGIAACKRVPDLIPLAHPVAVHHAAIELTVDVAGGTVRVECRVAARDRTGVEMEAMTGAAIAALTVYDMCKGENRGIVIGPLRLLHKSGGRSGVWPAAADDAASDAASDDASDPDCRD